MRIDFCTLLLSAKTHLYTLPSRFQVWASSTLVFFHILLDYQNTNHSMYDFN